MPLFLWSAYPPWKRSRILRVSVLSLSSSRCYDARCKAGSYFANFKLRLYAATDKGSSFIGPAVVGGLIDATGQVRSGFFFIAVIIVLPIPLVWMVNAEKGRRDGLAMADIVGKSQAGPSEDAQEAEGLLARDS